MLVAVVDVEVAVVEVTDVVTVDDTVEVEVDVDVEVTVGGLVVVVAVVEVWLVVVRVMPVGGGKANPPVGRISLNPNATARTRAFGSQGENIRRFASNLTINGLLRRMSSYRVDAV